MSNQENQLRQQLEWKIEEATRLKAELRQAETDRDKWQRELPIARASVAAGDGKYLQGGLDLIERYARDSAQQCQALSKGLKVKQDKIEALRTRLAQQGLA